MSPSASSESEQLQQRNRELSILNTIAQELNRSVDLNQALRAALAREIHVSAILRKLGADNRTEAVSLAAPLGLIDL